MLELVACWTLPVGTTLAKSGDCAWCLGRDCEDTTTGVIHQTGQKDMTVIHQRSCRLQPEQHHHHCHPHHQSYHHHPPHDLRYHSQHLKEREFFFVFLLLFVCITTITLKVFRGIAAAKSFTILIKSVLVMNIAYILKLLPPHSHSNHL